MEDLFAPFFAVEISIIPIVTWHLWGSEGILGSHENVKFQDFAFSWTSAAWAAYIPELKKNGFDHTTTTSHGEEEEEEEGISAP